MPSDSKVEAKPLNELLVAVAAQDRSAFAPLYEATSAKLFGVTLRILRNRQQAEEVLQEVTSEFGAAPPIAARRRARS